MQGMFYKFRAAFNIGQKGHIFIEKGPKNLTPLFNPF